MIFAEKRMARTIAISNQKGGVGKTTTAINLSCAVAAKCRRTLLIDLDPGKCYKRAGRREKDGQPLRLSCAYWAEPA